MKNKELSIYEIRDGLLYGNNTNLSEKIELVSLKGLPLIDKIKEIGRRIQIKENSGHENKKEGFLYETYKHLQNPFPIDKIEKRIQELKDFGPNKYNIMIESNQAFDNPDYYTPEISDIRVGYECELYNKVSNFWEEFIIDTSFLARGYSESKYDHDEQVRTKFLTKEQIEKEGWEQRGGKEFFYKLNYTLAYYNDNNFLYIEDNKERETLFRGKCPSINELRTICKLLGI